jgi:hypothetical protein
MRTVIFSDRIRKEIKNFPAIDDISYSLENGKEVTPWLSRQVLHPKTAKSDDMFNDWGITHFHLGKFFQNSRQTQRTDALLFAKLEPDFAIFLDVQRHGDWTKRDILRQLLYTAPACMELFEVKGIIGLTRRLEDSDLKTMRESRVNATIEIDGRYFFPPGEGLAASGQSVRFVRWADSLFENIDAIKSNIEKNSAPKHIVKKLTQVISLPVRLGVTLQSGCLVIWDKNRQFGIASIGPFS